MAYFRRLSSSAAAAAAAPKPKELLSLVKREREPSRILQLLSGLPRSRPPRPLRRALSLAVASLSSSSAPSVRLLLRSLPPTFYYRRRAVVLFGEAGMLDDARQLFDEMPPNRHSLRAIVSACVAAGKPEQAEGIILECTRKHDFLPHPNTCNPVVKALCESGRATSVLPIFDEFHNMYVSPSNASVDRLLDTLVKEGRLGDGDTLKEALRFHCSEDDILQALCRVGRLSEANELLKKKMLDGERPRAANYHHLIQGFCREGELEQAKRLFGEMKAACFVPNSECYLTMMLYLCKGGEFDEALEIYRLSVEKNWVPRLSTMRAMVEELVKGSRIEEARGIIQNMGERFPNKRELWVQLGERLLGSS